MNKRLLIVFGTRPELIKLAPLIKILEKSSLAQNILVVNTGQHDDLLKQQLDFWQIQPDVSLALESKKHLVTMLASTMLAFQEILDQNPAVEFIIIQGDTNTALAISQVGFLNNKKVVHIEAGLRSANLQHPFPEEFNRIIASKGTYFHFAPTALAENNLIREGIDPEKILVVGNTVIDALKWGLSTRQSNGHDHQKRILITLHRRENIQGNQFQLLSILQKIIVQYPSLAITWVMHPNCSTSLIEYADAVTEIEFLEAMPYNEFISLYASALMIITDSGGVIEEASELGIPTVVFREHTERLEPLVKDYPMIVSIEEESILDFVKANLFERSEPGMFYGDGNASKKIAVWLKNQLAEALPAAPALTNSV